MQMFLHYGFEATDKELIFDHEESKHMIKVLRHKAGDQIRIVNTRGLEAWATITQANPKACLVRIERTVQHPEPITQIHVAIAPTKQMERLEWFVEKATELGVHRITPVICHHSERKALRLDRLEKRRDAALKQSLSYYGVLIDPVCTMDEFLNQSFDKTDCYIAHCIDEIQDHLFTIPQHFSKAVVLIGPEGDFSPVEAQRAIDQGFIPVSLGERRLRTETAGIAAVQLLGIKAIL